MAPILLILASILFSAQKPFLVERAFFAMGSAIEFKVYCGEMREVCNEKIFKSYLEVKRLDDILSNYKPDSALSRLNSRAGMGKTPAPKELFDIASRSLHFSELTDGAFDISVGKLVDLWKEAARAKKIPERKLIKDTASNCVGNRHIKLYPDTLEIETTSDCLLIDFGGIGKGYAVDRAIESLKSQGIRSALVNFSGNIYALGAPHEEPAWVVGVKHPTKVGEFLAFIAIRDAGVSTSGDYERYSLIEGKRHSHIIDPRTGAPVESIPSVTVVSKSATDADALSTAFSVMGESGARGVLRKFSDTGAMIITRQRGGALKVYESELFKSLRVSGRD
ncbi:MAG: FAD:protein FMN transferase [Deltaproteobacteria bacterium]